MVLFFLQTITVLVLITCARLIQVQEQAMSSTHSSFVQALQLHCSESKRNADK